MKHITVNLLDYFWKTGIKPIIERIDNLHQVASTGKYTDLTERPTALKNPHTLNFTGGVTENYDGSVEKFVRIPSLTNNLLANVPGTALDAVQGKALADELSQINSKFTPTHQTGLTPANNNVTLYRVSFFTMSKLCVISFEVVINSVFSTGELIRLPEGFKAYGTYHFACDFANSCKHAWISDNQDVICIQNGAEKTGNLRGEVVFMLR